MFLIHKNLKNEEDIFEENRYFFTFVMNFFEFIY